MTHAEQAVEGILSGIPIEYWFGGRAFRPWLWRDARLWKIGTIKAHRCGVVSIQWDKKPDFMPRCWNIVEKEFTYWLSVGILRIPIGESVSHNGD